MTSLPSLLILTNRGRMVAYQTTQAGHLEQIDSLEPVESNHKISELVTDQAGAFPTNKVGMAAYESMPLLDEMKTRADRQIAGRMKEILEQHRPYSWGFAAPSQINNGILEMLHADLKRNLVCNLKIDLTKTPPDQVRDRFEKETAPTFN